jgi:hypothetical protein
VTGGTRAQEPQIVAMNGLLLKEMAALIGGKFLRLDEASACQTN